MPELKTVYMMAFTPEAMETPMLMTVCQMAADRLSAKDATFAQRMNMRGPKTRMAFSNQLLVATMHSPSSMQATLAGWLKNENVSFEPRLGDSFFPYGMRDPQGRENYILFYFDLKESYLEVVIPPQEHRGGVSDSEGSLLLCWRFFAPLRMTYL